jgi:hypothetical protein
MLRAGLAVRQMLAGRGPQTFQAAVRLPKRPASGVVGAVIRFDIGNPVGGLALQVSEGSQGFQA